MIKIFSVGSRKQILGGIVYGVYDIAYESFVFSGGEIQVIVGPKGVPHSILPVEIRIEADLFSANDFIELIMVVDAVRRRGAKTLHLVCKYMPYARQDRVMNPGEALGVKVAADMINSLGFESVEIWDAHSDTTLALINNVKHITQSQLVRLVPVFTPDIILVAPDAGAMKKVLDTAKSYGRSMITAEKIRDTKTGVITGTKVHSEGLGSQDVLIVDDICDGGRTFIELAKALRFVTTGKIYLYVTHGIFSKGLDVFDGFINHIYSANIWPNVDPEGTNHILSRLDIPNREN